MNPKRYDIDHIYFEDDDEWCDAIVEKEKGDYVKYGDYQELEAKLAWAVGLIKKYEQEDW